MTVSEFIGKKVTYDKYGGQYLWGIQADGSNQMIGELRGWGAIQNLFRQEDGSIDFPTAEAFQDEVGDWVAEAITEKLNREKDPIEILELDPNTPIVIVQKGTIDLGQFQKGAMAFAKFAKSYRSPKDVEKAWIAWEENRLKDFLKNNGLGEGDITNDNIPPQEL